MSSEISIERSRVATDDPVQVRGARAGAASAVTERPFSSLWQTYALLGMIAAAAAVWASRHTHPLALVLLSGAALAAAFVALTLHRAVAALFGRSGDVEPLDERRRDVLEKEKALVLRSIKELEFDRAMGKIGDEDFAEIERRLRARALTLMQDLERAVSERPAPVPRGGGRKAAAPEARRACSRCRTENDLDAKFCKRCGTPLAVNHEAREGHEGGSGKGLTAR